MKFKWQIDLGGNGEEHIEIRPDAKEVVIWGWQGHWKNESGGFTSFDKFLEGELHSWILQYHGQGVLDEVISTVKEIEGIN